MEGHMWNWNTKSCYNKTLDLNLRNFYISYTMDFNKTAWANLVARVEKKNLKLLNEWDLETSKRCSCQPVTFHQLCQGSTNKIRQQENTKFSLRKCYVSYTLNIAKTKWALLIFSRKSSWNFRIKQFWGLRNQ